jgi:penicillin-binding protein 2
MKPKLNSSPRILFFIIFLMGFFTLLFVRLIDVQIIQGQDFLKKAENNRFYTQRVSPQRGVFLDRYQDPLVWNIQKYFRIENPAALYSKLDPLDRDTALALMATDSAHVITEHERLYRYPQSLAHVVGYISDVNAEDLQRDETLHISQQIGKAGLEYVFEKQLKGVEGSDIYEVNALGEKQRKIKSVEPQAGQNIQTTLDPYVNEVALRALGEQRGGVVISNSETGEILAMTSRPSFDANFLSQSYIDPQKEAERKEQISRFFSDPQKLFFNRMISGAYPPGSVFKLVTALAGLETGKITNSTTVEDQGVIKVGGSEFGNWYFRQYGRVEGTINLTRAIARSNDIYFYKAAEWTGPTVIAQTSRILGLGEKTGVNLPAETRGLIPDPEWKEKVKKERWFLGDTYHIGIGQGDILTSPIQIAQMTQSLANNGSLCKVSLIKSDKADCRQVTTSSEHLATILEGMIEVCTSGGTAFPFFPYNAKYLVEGQSTQAKIDAGAVACKTGTAEFGASDARGYKKTHGWFTAILTLPDLRSGTSESEGTETEGNAAVIATDSGQLQLDQELIHLDKMTELSNEQLHNLWQKKIGQTNFPRRITITVLVESDDQNLYKEGSADAAPIAKKIVDWMGGVAWK